MTNTYYVGLFTVTNILVLFGVIVCSDRVAITVIGRYYPFLL